MGLFRLRSKDIGIDLGTANILVTIKGRGIVLREPAVVAIDIKSDQIVATGSEAKEMIGRTPETIEAKKPLEDGVIADFTATKLLLKNILKKVYQKYNASRPRAIVSVPYGITEVEERAVEESIIHAGAKEVYLIEEPMAAAIGAGLPIHEPSGNMVVDLGAGTTEVAVISLGGIVVSDSVRIAGDKLNKDIINYIKKELNLSIGETTAEEIKEQIGCATKPMTEMNMEIRGRDLSTGLPKNVTITSTQILEALSESIGRIVDVVKFTLEKTPPELASDLIEKGLVLTGGGALLQNMDKIISDATNMPVYIADEPLECVVRGTGKVLEELEKLKQIIIKKRKRK